MIFSLSIPASKINLAFKLALLEFLIDWPSFDRQLSLAIDRLWADLAGCGNG